METWQLDSVSGSTPEFRAYCIELWQALVTTFETHGNEIHRILHRDRATREAYEIFHNRVKKISKRNPGDVLTIHYTWDVLHYTAETDNGEPGKIHTVEYENGEDRVISIESATYIDEPLNDIPC